MLLKIVMLSPIVQRARRFDFSNFLDIVGKLEYHDVRDIQDKYRRITATGAEKRRLAE